MVGRARPRRAGRGLGCALGVLGGLVVGCGREPEAPPRPVLVFVLDSGVSSDFVAGKVTGYVTGEPVSHGSLVARVIRQRCAGCTIHSLRAETLGGSMQREAYLEALREAAAFVADRPGAAVLVNISLGSDEPDPAERRLIGELTRRGAVVVAAAGNDDSEAPIYPAGYDEVLAVAAANDRGNRKERSSSYGRHVDLVAPARIEFIDTANVPAEVLENQVAGRGTSFAAPRVTGTLAEMLVRRRDLTAVEAAAIVRRTARPMLDEPRYRAGLLGAGSLDAYAALGAVDAWYGVKLWAPLVAAGVLAAGSLAYLWGRHGAYGVLFWVFLWAGAAPIALFAGGAALWTIARLGGGSFWRGLAAVAGPAAAVAAACELRVRMQLRAIRRAVGQAGPEACQPIARTWSRARSVRVAAAAAAALGELQTPEATTRLLNTRPRARRRAVRQAVGQALRRLAATRPDLLTPHAEHRRYGRCIRRLLAAGAEGENGEEAGPARPV